MEFTIGDMVIEALGSYGDDRAIEFWATVHGAEAPAVFAIHREHDKDWESACLTVDPSSGSVPVAAVEWAVEFAREYL
ncbi:hypothetical protein [Streptomyces sp. NBC_00503]|uniref:hypothetical protein n=1 Tax=Streptomyces sp. NBC_00503 TaxID=2903659 RepID=UPI002E802C47|nr:hypothetical protein [Streptomyces sp. NBC_00503]WUD83304.1 hypothetical protein OG490_23635 [Streptomyces sp. NBC_00503]